MSARPPRRSMRPHELGFDERQGMAQTKDLATDTALDPVCGMRVKPARAAAQVEHAGKPYYFCSRGCAERFKQDPERYLKTDGTNHDQGASPAAANPPLVQLGTPSSAMQPAPLVTL